MKYFAKYRPQAGFKFSLDGIFNVPTQSDYYVGVYCLNPPGNNLLFLLLKQLLLSRLLPTGAGLHLSAAELELGLEEPRLQPEVSGGLVHLQGRELQPVHEHRH